MEESKECSFIETIAFEVGQYNGRPRTTKQLKKEKVQNQENKGIYTL